MQVGKTEVCEPEQRQRQRGPADGRLKPAVPGDSRCCRNEAGCVPPKEGEKGAATEPGSCAAPGPEPPPEASEAALESNSADGTAKPLGEGGQEPLRKAACEAAGVSLAKLEAESAAPTDAEGKAERAEWQRTAAAVEDVEPGDRAPSPNRREEEPQVAGQERAESQSSSGELTKAVEQAQQERA